MPNATIYTLINAAAKLAPQIVCFSNKGALFSEMSRIIFVYFYPLALLLCLFGNSMNLILYSQPFLRGSSVIRLLAAKAVANTIYMLCLAPQELVFFESTRRSVEAQKFYWATMRIFLFLANTFGTAAAWITVVLTLESYICVAKPMKAQSLSTHRNAKIAVFFCILIAGMLNLIFIVNRWVEECYCEASNQSQTCFNLTIANYFNRPPQLANATYGDYYYSFKAYSLLYETFYQYASSVLAVIFPVFTLVVLALLLNWELRRTRSSSASLPRNTSVQKQCVNRLTLGTSICHLIFESPQVAIYILAAVKPIIYRYGLFLDFVAVANYLSMLNASVPFLIYYICSQRFRTLCKYLYCAGICPISEQDRQNLEAEQTAACEKKRTKGRSMSMKRLQAKPERPTTNEDEAASKLAAKRERFNSLPNPNFKIRIKSATTGNCENSSDCSLLSDNN